MKKWLLVIALIFLVGCSNETQNSTTTEVVEEETEAKMEVEKNLLSVDVTLPYEFVEQEDEELNVTLEELAKEDGINEVTDNIDGTVTMNMTKSKHTEVLKSLSDSIDEHIDELIASEDNSIVKIETSDNYKTFDLYVDPSQYNSLTEAFSAISFYFQGLLYNAYDGNSDSEIIVNFIDNETGEVIEQGSSKNLGSEEETSELEESNVIEEETVALEETNNISEIIPFRDEYGDENLELMVHSFDWVDTVEPWTPGEYYNYYSVEDPNTAKLIKLEAIYKNLGGDTIDLNDYAYRVVINDKYNYNLQATYEEDGDLVVLNYVDPLEEKNVFIFGEVPIEAIESIEKIVFQFGYNEGYNNMFENMEQRENILNFEIIETEL